VQAELSDEALSVELFMITGTIRIKKYVHIFQPITSAALDYTASSFIAVPKARFKFSIS
jgi:hypothetical protein